MTAERASRRRIHPAWVAVVVLVVLLAIAAVAAEVIARRVIVSTVETAIRSQVELPDGTAIDTEVLGSPVITQVISGRLDGLDIRLDDVVVSGLRGSASVYLRDIPLDAAEATGTVEVVIVTDESSLTAIGDNLSGLGTDRISIADDEIVLDYSFSILGAGVPVVVGLTPVVIDGALAFDGSSLALGGLEISADALVDRFGSAASDLLRTTPVCLADQLPAGVVLDDVRVDGDELRLRLGGADIVLSDLATRGTCA